MHSESPSQTERAESATPTKRRRGFAALSPERMKQIASLGGRAAHAAGSAHRFSPDAARDAGREGGRRVSEDRAHMAEIGRRGGHQRSANLKQRQAALELPLVLPGPALPLLLALLLLFVLPFPAAAQQMPAGSITTIAAGNAPTLREPLLPAFGGLSDGGPVLSPYIDRLAFNARVDFLFLSDSPERQQAFVIPYGFSFAALHLVEGGIYTHHTFWKEGARSRSYNAPLGLNLKVRLWRWFAKDPNQHFTLVAAYQHEVRTGPFDGPNQLGLFTDLAALRIAASWPVWLFDIGASVGALYDYQGRFGTGELGARLGVRLDFIRLEDTRASVEGILRGVPAYVRPDAALPGATDPQNPIGLSGALFFGVNTRMTKTADFGIWAQTGFGDVAPLSFGVRVLGIFIGEGYLRPRPVWAEIVKEVATWLREQMAAIDPVFGKDCIAYDTDSQHTPMGPYGRLTDDEKFCERNGYRVPVGVDLFRNKKGTLLCWDDKLRDCLLRRENPHAPWVPIHRPRLDADCILKDSDGSFLERLGEPAGDGKTCRWRAKDQHGRTIDRELEIGRLYHADPDLRRVCFNEDLTGCFVDRSDHGPRWNGLQQAAAHLGLGLDDGVADLKKTADTAEAVASGKVNVKTIAQEAAAEAEHSIERCASAGAACAKRVFNDTLRASRDALQKAQEWAGKPTQEKINDAMRAAGKAGVNAPATLAAGGAVGGVTRAAGGVVEHQLEKAVARAAKNKVEKAATKAVTHEGQRAAVHIGEEQARRVAQDFAKRDAARATNEPERLRIGKRAHREDPLGPTEKAEVRTPSKTGRMDRYDETNAHIREIKPNNPRQIRAGERQLERYRKEMEVHTGRPHTTEVTTYDPAKYR